MKNFSLIFSGNKIELSPAYDLVNSTIIFQQMGRPLEEVEESALPLSGKKRKLTRKLFIDYFAKERLELSNASIQKHLDVLRGRLKFWLDLIDRSFLDPEAKELYKTLVLDRFKRLNLD